MLLNCRSFLTYIISCSAFMFHCSGRWMKSKAVLPKLTLSGYIWAMSCWNDMKCKMLPRGAGFPAGVFTLTMPLAAIVLVFSLQIDCDWGESQERPGDEAENWLKTWSLSHSNIHTRTKTSVDMFQYYSVNNNSSLHSPLNQYKL